MLLHICCCRCCGSFSLRTSARRQSAAQQLAVRLSKVIVFSSVFIMLEAKLALAFSQRPSMCEASLLQAVGPDLDYVRSFIDVMVKRLSSGGGCVSFFFRPYPDTTFVVV